MDLFTEPGLPENPHMTPALRTALECKLVGDLEQHDLAFDAGTGIAGRTIVGSLFWVRAATVGGAADASVAAFTDAAAEAFGRVLSLYEVTVIPREAVALPDDPYYPHTST